MYNILKKIEQLHKNSYVNSIQNLTFIKIIKHLMNRKNLYFQYNSITEIYQKIL